MKIGLVRRGYSSTGGAEAYLRRFADAARAAGHECVLFSQAWPDDQWRGGLHRISGSDPRAFADALERAKPRAHCDILFSLERVWSCDVYRAGDGVHAAWLERRAAFESPWRAPLRRIFNGKHKAILELEAALFAKNGARVVIANSELVRSEIVAHYGTPADRVHVIYNGIDLSSAVPSPSARDRVRAELGIDATRFVALFAGSGFERKGLPLAVAAIEEAYLAAPLLLVAGRGKRPRIGNPSRVRLLGPRRDVPDLMAASDVFLLPTQYDPFSNASLEALAAGLPVLTTRANGFGEIIEPGVEGEVFDSPADVSQIGRALEKWAEPDRREAVRESLRAKAARFSMEENLRKTLAVLQGGLSS